LKGVGYRTATVFPATIVAQPAVETFGVAEYRAYTVGRDGHFNGIEPLNCADDAEAIEKAQRLVDGHDVKLWSSERFVTRLKRAAGYCFFSINLKVDWSVFGSAYSP
jgi:hypothetical protein